MPFHVVSLQIFAARNTPLGNDINSLENDPNGVACLKQNAPNNGYGSEAIARYWLNKVVDVLNLTALPEDDHLPPQKHAFLNIYGQKLTKTN